MLAGKELTLEECLTRLNFISMHYFNFLKVTRLLNGEEGVKCE